MCLLAVLVRTVPGAPVLIAANREERYDRPAEPPAIRDGSPQVLCPTDATAGGTWLGVNAHRLAVAVTNRRRSTMPPAPRSRGLLCVELLASPGAAEAAQRAFRELGRGRYAGANYLCIDPTGGAIVHGGDRHSVMDVKPGLHVVTNGDLDDPGDGRLAHARRLMAERTITSVGEFVDAARAVCAHPDVVLRRDGGGTVSSQIIALTDDPAEAVYLHAPGPPDRTPYEDFSSLLRRLEVGGRE